MHLNPCVYLYFYATVVMKSYLITFYAHLLENIRFYQFQFFTYNLTSVVHSATLNERLYFITEAVFSVV